MAQALRSASIAASLCGASEFVGSVERLGAQNGARVVARREGAGVAGRVAPGRLRVRPAVAGQEPRVPADRAGLAEPEPGEERGGRRDREPREQEGVHQPDAVPAVQRGVRAAEVPGVRADPRAMGDAGHLGGAVSGGVHGRDMAGCREGEWRSQLRVVCVLLSSCWRMWTWPVLARLVVPS
jgi:hypothetical protein